MTLNKWEIRLIQIIFYVFFDVNTGFEHYAIFTHPWHKHTQFRVRYVSFPSKFSRLVLFSCRSAFWSRVTDVSSWTVTKCAQPTETNRLIIAKSANFCNGNFKLGCDKGDNFFLIFFSRLETRIRVNRRTDLRGDLQTDIKLSVSVTMKYTFKPNKIQRTMHTNLMQFLVTLLLFKGPQSTDQHENLGLWTQLSAYHNLKEFLISSPSAVSIYVIHYQIFISFAHGNQLRG